MNNVIKYPLRAAIELCEQLDNNLPTPETDDIARGNHVVPTEWAKQLERERYEAREDLEHWKIEYEIVVSRLCGIKHERDNGIIAEHEIIPVLRKERDEAREEAHRFRSLYYARSGIDKSASWFPWEASLNLAQKAQSIAENIRQRTPETDDFELNLGDYSNPWKAIEFARKLERERDEAREALDSREVVIAKQNVITDLLLERDQEIKINLCYYDPENPNSNLDAYEDEDRPQPRNGCGCDNCYYGRDKLAMQLIESKRERNEAREALMRIEDLFLDGTDIYADRENMGLIARVALEDTKKQLQGIDKGI